MVEENIAVYDDNFKNHEKTLVIYGKYILASKFRVESLKEAIKVLKDNLGNCEEELFLNN